MSGSREIDFQLEQQGRAQPDADRPSLRARERLEPPLELQPPQILQVCKYIQ